MKFLIDNSISPAVADGLRQAGYDSVHLRERGIEAALDDVVIDTARGEDRIIVTYDLDFPRLLSLRRDAKPSLILFRRLRHPADQASILLDNLPSLQHDLTAGCIAVFEPERIRVRDLPLSRHPRASDE